MNLENKGSIKVERGMIVRDESRIEEKMGAIYRWISWRHVELGEGRSPGQFGIMYFHFKF